MTGARSRATAAQARRSGIEGPLRRGRANSAYRPKRAGTNSKVSRGCQGRLRERLPARPQNVTPLRQAVVRYARSCGASARRREDIALAVSEAISNVVLHAYVGRQDMAGCVGVEAWMDDDNLAVVVFDEGGGMSRRDDSPGLGLGLGLIDQMADTLEVEDSRPGLRVRMTFALS